ncbi:OmpH family outer membrane protein [Streptomyces rubellomurinus]|uniref:Uncharacterized protein n=1 Tax=Streptomyces rubellomurinus (strain ATCC 31215) TaxID=359131 RepID=A0A0F2TII6_STRR3|nr:OmpH family outer membrane protein [Streptomyces rubellomurinus]KJS61522.1 hypothetical protein VM95_14595 [Streptomyces rubellomurinus]
MTTATAPRTVPTLGEVVRQLPGWLREHVWSAVTGAVAGGVIGYVVNVLLIAVRYGGWRKVPHGAPATSHGNFFQGALFWGLLTTVLFGVFGYWHAVGTARFLADLRALPRTLAALVRGDRASGVHLLWGAAVALLAAQIVPPAAGAVLAVGVLAGAPSVLGSIVSTFLRRVWSAVVKQVAPTRHHRITGVTGMTVGMLGSAASLVAAAFVTDTAAKFVLAAVLAAAAVLLATTRTRPPATACLLLVGAVLVLHGITDAVPARADDGGSLECKLQGRSWLSCTGSGTVLRYSAAGAAAAGLGGVLGSFLGHLAGSLAGGPGTGGPDEEGPGTGGPHGDGDGDRDRDGDGGAPWQPQAQPALTPGDRRAINNWIQGLLDDPAFQRWCATHPGFTGPPTDAEFNQYLNWRRAQGIADPALTLPGARADLPVDAGPLPPLPPPDPLPLLPDLPPGPEPLDAGPAGDDQPPPDQPPAVAPAPAAAAPAPDPAQAIRDRLAALDGANMYDPSFWGQLQALHESVDPAQGLTPDQLQTVQQLEAMVPKADETGNEQRETIRNAGMDALQAAEARGSQADRDYTDYLHQLAATEARENYLGNLIDHLPPGQFEMANRVLQQIESGAPGTDTAGALRQLTTALVGQAQGRSEREAADAELEAAAAEAHEAAAVGWQHVAIAGELLLAPFAVPLTAAGAAGLGAFMVGRNAVQGFGVGYEEGGFTKGLLGMANAVLPINTLQAAYQATIGQVVDPNSADPHAGRLGIALAFVQDLGNAVGLHSLGLQNIGPAAADAVKETPVLSRLSGGQPPPGPVPTATAATDAAFLAEQAAGRKAADEFQQMAADLRALKAAGASPDEIAAAQQALKQKVVELNSLYQGKASLKTAVKEIQGQYAEVINPVLEKARVDTVDALNAQGWRRGGRLLTPDDLTDLRNAKSLGTVGMDRDLALQQMKYRETLAQLEKVPPNSDRAAELYKQLKDLKAQNQLTLNGAPVSASNANEAFDQAYGKAYANATGGQDAKQALQAVTQSKHPEAYQDLPVLKNDALGYPPDPKWAAQTGSVTTYKTFMNPHDLSPGSALQETARGVAKDISTKLEPMMYYYQGADPGAYQRVLDMKAFLGDCGKGVYTPTQMELLSQQKFGTSINGLAQQVDSNLTAFVQSHGAAQPAFRSLPGPGLSELGGHVAQAAGGQAGNVLKGVASGPARGEKPAEGK